MAKDVVLDSQGRVRLEGVPPMQAMKFNDEILDVRSVEDGTRNVVRDGDSKFSLLIKTEIWYNGGMKKENGFWKVCEALDCNLRIELLRYLLEVEKTEFPCVNELAEKFQVSAAAMSIHLKKLATVGLVVSKRADRRVYYRAFAATVEGERVLASLRRTIQSRPSAERFCRLREYAHALSHLRRHLIVRCLYVSPGLSLAELAMRTEMPPQTADRLLGELAKAHIVDLNGVVIAPESEPEVTLLELTLA